MTLELLLTAYSSYESRSIIETSFRTSSALEHGHFQGDFKPNHAENYALDTTLHQILHGSSECVRELGPRDQLLFCNIFLANCCMYTTTLDSFHLLSGEAFELIYMYNLVFLQLRAWTDHFAQDKPLSRV